MSSCSDGWIIADTVVSGVITLLGVWYWFLANGGARGRDFLGRVTALTWVVGNRMLLYLLPLFLVATMPWVFDTILEQPWYARVYPVLDAIITWTATIWTIIFVWWVRCCLRDLHRHSSSPPPTEISACPLS